PPVRGADQRLTFAWPLASLIVCIQYTWSAVAVMPSKEPPSVTDWDCSTRGAPVAGTSARSVCCPSALAITPTDAVLSRTTAGVYAEPSGNVAGIGKDRAPGQT